MTKILSAVLSLMLVCAGDAKPSLARAAPAPNAIREQALPIIAVSGSEIKINGKNIWLGDTLETWKHVLGGLPTCYDDGITTCVWHSNGLMLGTDQADRTRVKFLNLHVAIEPPELGERAPSWPKSPFHGTLQLDGVPIYASTVFSDLRRQVASSRELRCGGRDCWEPSAAFSDGANIYMSLSGRSESSRILHFAISCTSTAACTKLIPNHGKK